MPGHPHPKRIALADLQQFFADLSYRLNLVETAQRVIDKKLATGFNVFGFIEPNEGKLSDVLAELLSPDGCHGQGDLFLKLLFQKFGFPTPANLGATAKVQREAPTHRILNRRRRIDILVEAGALLAIENKVDSFEQLDQVQHYIEHLRHCARSKSVKFALMYLSPDGRYPDTLRRTTIDKWRRESLLYCWSYDTQLRDWLEECRRSCESDKVRYFLADFICHIDSALRRNEASELTKPK